MAYVCQQKIILNLTIVNVAYLSYVHFLYIIYFVLFYCWHCYIPCNNFLMSECMLYMCLCFGTYILWLFSAYLVSYKVENYDSFYRHGKEIWVRIFQKPYPSSIPVVILAYVHGEKCNIYPTFLHLMLVLSWLRHDLEEGLSHLDIVVMEIIFIVSAKSYIPIRQ
jgi:hypothetical protein